MFCLLTSCLRQKWEHILLTLVDTVHLHFVKYPISLIVLYIVTTYKKMYNHSRMNIKKMLSMGLECPIVFLQQK